MNNKFFFILFLVLSTCFAFGQNKAKTYLFVGSYTSGVSADGIYVFDFNTQTGEVVEVEREANLINPSFLAIAPNGKYLYACNETQLDKHGSVSAFKIDTLTGKITFLNKESTGGRNPAHVTVDLTGKYVIASNYTDAGVCIFKCNANGSLIPYEKLIEFEGQSIIKGRQEEAHMHSSNMSPDNKYVFAPDLGSDKIRVLSLSNEHMLTIVDSLTIESKQGSGPRHFTFHPNKPFAYCIEELSGTVSFYNYINGQLSLHATYPLYQQKHKEYASADIHVSPDGKYLYASNRKAENSISIFSINPKNGELTAIAHQSTFGTIPRSFVIEPTGKHLLVANKTSNNIVIFKRNTETGLLTKIGVINDIKTPSSLKMIQYGK